MNTPTLDLHGIKHHEVQNVVTRFIEDHLGKGLFIDVITGNSQEMLFEAVKVIKQYGLEFHTGLPCHQGRIRVVMYDDYH
jgi:ethanolamine ammonia-lyase small subunit